jgi:hypothetical protein
LVGLYEQQGHLLYLGSVDVDARGKARGTPKGPSDSALTDPDPNNLKSAAAYLLQIARNSEGRRLGKQPKIDALREYKLGR